MFTKGGIQLYFAFSKEKMSPVDESMGFCISIENDSEWLLFIAWPLGHPGLDLGVFPDALLVFGDERERLEHLEPGLTEGVPHVLCAPWIGWI